MSRLYHVCAMTIILLGAWLIALSSIGAAPVSLTLTPGSLSISPTTVQFSYHIPVGNAERTVTSSFAVTVTDATGTAAGWAIRAASVGAIGPLGQTPYADHAIIGIRISSANGIPPDPTCMCGMITPGFAVLFQTPAHTGVGHSTEVFTTQLKVPADAPAGWYAATMMLNVASLGAVSMLPGVQPSASAAPSNPAPTPLPVIQPAPALPAASGNLNPLPVVRPGAPPLNLPIATTASVNPLPSVRPSAPPLNVPIGTAPAPQPNGNSAPVTNTEPPVAIASGNTPAVSTPLPSVVPGNGPAGVGRFTEETAAPSPTNVAASTTVALATALPPNVTASSIVIATPVPPSSTVSTVASGNDAKAPAGNSALATTAIVKPPLAAPQLFPVVTTIGNAITFMPSLITDEQGWASERINWHLQATYTVANHPAISRVFGRNASGWLPMHLSIGTVFFVMTEGGIGQATVSVNAQQAVSDDVVTISILAGP